MKISHLDHLVLTVSNIETTCHFYQTVLGFEVITFKGNRKALKFGNQKINLHQQGNEFEPKALQPTPGSADLCFISDTPISEVVAYLNQLNIQIEEGPIERTGAMHPILSVYIRDPDQNLIEISNILMTQPSE
ncbi:MULTISPECIES: VOC family protein [Acinetobacter]|jgi:catechol 2,3-dioxygenase-like lactoylglutathione lyase family enzyme|uniref:VOC family protein n=1 Tax=Acinetobacter pittii TaxID=48296 RepID=A0AAE9SAH3_ACIPI|nr:MULTISPECIES: VOC family protein [Acinetobacter]AZP30942.1 VOC family protein [Acinetobacter pittii]EXC28891.1 glyoxalase/bleomycin resistance protein/dioxygenase family protein [Acinetobacter sp. 809848]EXS18160.1 glyoxalase/bleomycin resistance protein/dioxygenase family protein [Acinetobacter sp. 883425]KRI81324.1 virulence protein [Acinetobacter pittii]KRJ67508.1 virulence protein [Acinetobacter pittii]